MSEDVTPCRPGVDELPFLSEPIIAVIPGKEHYKTSSQLRTKAMSILMKIISMLKGPIQRSL